MVSVKMAPRSAEEVEEKQETEDLTLGENPSIKAPVASGHI